MDRREKLHIPGPQQTAVQVRILIKYELSVHVEQSSSLVLTTRRKCQMNHRLNLLKREIRNKQTYMNRKIDYEVWTVESGNNLVIKQKNSTLETRRTKAGRYTQCRVLSSQVVAHRLSPKVVSACYQPGTLKRPKGGYRNLCMGGAGTGLGRNCHIVSATIMLPFLTPCAKAYDTSGWPTIIPSISLCRDGIDHP